MKYQFEQGMINSNYLIYHNLYQAFKIIFSTLQKKKTKKKHETLIDNTPINIYVNRTENKISFKVN